MQQRIFTHPGEYTQLDRRRFVSDTWDNGSRLGRVMVECTLSITHCLRLNLQLHTIDLVRTCGISSFCTVAWQSARFQLTRRIARSLGDSWASCFKIYMARWWCSWHIAFAACCLTTFDHPFRACVFIFQAGCAQMLTFWQNFITGTGFWLKQGFLCSPYLFTP